MAIANQPQYGGYEYEFVEKVPARCVCSVICSKICRDPHLLVCCGKHVCETCLNQWIKSQEKLKQQEEQQKKTMCPHCRRENFIHVEDLSVRQEIDELKIRCIHCLRKDLEEEGCSWVGELSTLKTHLASEKGCGYVEVDCPNKCKKQLKRKNLTTHTCTCQHCEKEDTYQTITEKHYDECPNYPLDCPNGCGVRRIKRAEMGHHRRTCPLELIDCSNRCKKQLLRKDLDDHLTQHCPLRQYKCQHCGKEDTFQAITEKHYDECPNYPLDCPNECGARGIQRAEMGKHQGECPMQPVECPFKEAGCPAVLVRKEFDSHMATNQQQHLLTLMGAFKEAKAELGATKNELGATKNELGATKDDLNKTKTEMKTTQEVIATDVMIMHQTGYQKELSDLALASIETHAQLSIRSFRLKHSGQPLTFRMTNFSHYQQNHKVWYSPPFYNDTGYKMQLAVYANGTGAGAGTHVSIALLLMKGEFDHQIDSPIETKYVIETVSQTRIQTQERRSHAKLVSAKVSPPTYASKPAASITICSTCTPANCVTVDEGVRELGSEERSCDHNTVSNALLLHDSLVFRITAKQHDCVYTLQSECEIGVPDSTSQSNFPCDVQLEPSAYNVVRSSKPEASTDARVEKSEAEASPRTAYHGVKDQQQTAFSCDAVYCEGTSLDLPSRKQSDAAKASPRAAYYVVKTSATTTPRAANYGVKDQPQKPLRDATYHQKGSLSVQQSSVAEASPRTAYHGVKDQQQTAFSCDAVYCEGTSLDLPSRKQSDAAKASPRAAYYVVKTSATTTPRAANYGVKDQPQKPLRDATYHQKGSLSVQQSSVAEASPRTAYHGVIDQQQTAFSCDAVYCEGTSLDLPSKKQSDAAEASPRAAYYGVKTSATTTPRAANYGVKYQPQKPLRDATYHQKGSLSVQQSDAAEASPRTAYHGVKDQQQTASSSKGRKQRGFT